MTPAAKLTTEAPMEEWNTEKADFWHSPELDKIGGALAKAQGEIEGADKSSTNPHFKSKYADLAAIWDACRKPLAKHEIAVVQFPSQSSVTTMLIHASGQFLASRLSMRALDDRPQSVGSVITYARRYALAAMTGVAPEDDDGNAASGRDRNVTRDPDPVSQPRSAPRPVSANPVTPKTNGALDGSVQTMWAKMSLSKTDALEVFANLKTSLSNAIGQESGDRAYYATLGRYGVEHANEFKKSSDARLAAKDMLDAIHDATEVPETPFDDSLPFGAFGGQ